METKITMAQAKAIVGRLPRPWNAICAVQLLTGSRVSEISNLTSECISFEGPRVIVKITEHELPDGKLWKPKTASGYRTVSFIGSRAMQIACPNLYQQTSCPNPLTNIVPNSTQTACQTPEDWGLVKSEEYPNSLVFWHGMRQRSIRPLNHYLKRVCEELGVPQARSHDFRRVRIVQALSSGADANTVRASVGHSSLFSTLIYLKNVPVRCDLPDIDEVSDGSKANAWLPLVQRRSK